MVPSAATLTFEHSYTWWGNRRKLRVAARPNVTLSAQHVPARCRRARTVLLGPLTPDDVDCLSFIQQPGTLLVPAMRVTTQPRRGRCSSDVGKRATDRFLKGTVARTAAICSCHRVS